MDKVVTAFRRYVSELVGLIEAGTEHSYRSSLITLFKELFDDCKLINEPKAESKELKIDLRVIVKDRNVGYIETKDIGTNLDKVLEGEQLKRYVSSVHNLILTDYLNFILIRNGSVSMRASIIHQAINPSIAQKLDQKNIEEVKNLLLSFLQYKIPQITSAQLLADYLSKKAKILKMLATDGIVAAAQNKPAPIPFKDFVMLIYPLLMNADPDEYVDAYAQTMTFGILLARSMGDGKQITKENAAKFVPSSVKIIRRILLNIIEPDLPVSISWLIDDIFDAVNASDLNKVLADIKDKTGAVKDAFLLFYEDFLRNYDPEKRKKHGVYYTPRPVVSFIVNNVSRILRDEFGKELSLGSDDVTILDPSCGTGTFLAMAQLLAILSVKGAGYGGLIPKKIENHILKDFFGFEILVAPYVMAHLKLTRELEKSWGYKFSDGERVQIYLTNTLHDKEIQNIYAFDEILQETRTASELKLKKKVMVILGNPPYSGLSQNKGGYIEESIKTGRSLDNGSQIQGYYTIDGEPLEEKNPKWLLDDYVKFIRFGQLKIAQSGEGILAYVSNNGYLDNPTFRGMRQSLLSTFDTIYVINLHGSSRKREGVTGDENIFDIKQGVTITFFIKHNDDRPRIVKYSEIYGSREEKFKWLNNRFLSQIEFQDVLPQSPHYLFIPLKTSVEYQLFPSIIDIFEKYSVGIATARDKFTIDFDKEALIDRLDKFIKLSESDARELFSLGEDAEDWKVTLAQEDVRSSKLSDQKFVRITYRPFDVRFTYYTGKSKGLICRPRKDIMENMLNENEAIVTTRGSKPEPWRDVFAADNMTDIALLSANTSRSSYHFPLYIYEEGRRLSNIKTEIIENLSEKYGQKISPETLFDYIYGLLNSPKYRNKYEKELQRDFPRIWFPEAHDVFQKISNLGRKLIDLHTKKTKISGMLGYTVAGDNIIRKIEYVDGTICINETQCFVGCSQEIWDFTIGSYKVLEKWLKSRKGRSLTSADVEMFSKIASIIKATLQIQETLDSFIGFL